MTSPQKPLIERRSALVVATGAALVFQLGHLIEHTVQMIVWILHPQRSPWMSPWAHELALLMGRIPSADSAEMTSAMQRGMEVLHLAGNTVFLGGTVGLWWLVRRRHEAATGWAKVAMVLQGLHTLEHVALTATVLLTGRAIGISTWFGSLGGTVASTQRVWWHGLVNLFASLIVLRALQLAFARSANRAEEPVANVRRTLRPAPAAIASVALVFAIPVVLSLSVGRSSEAADSAHAHDRDHDHGGHDDHRSGLVDVAADRGLISTHGAFRWDVTGDPVAMMGGGICWIDVDDDGWLDLFVTNTWSDGEWGLWDSGDGLPTTQLFRNVEGQFEDVTEAWGAGFAVRALGCTVADLDVDGDLDLYVTTSRSNLLLLNDGGERLVDVAPEAGADSYGWQAGAAAGDLDGDGLPDLVLSGYADLNAPLDDADSGFPRTVAPRPDVVLFGTGIVDGVPRFDEVDGSQLGLEPDGAEYGLDVVLADLDGDGDLDVHIANDTQPNRLYRNDLATGGGFVDIAVATGMADDGSGMGVAVADLNADGVLDVGVTNLAGQGHRVFASDDGGWTAMSGPIEVLGMTETGWGFTFTDLDNDGVADAVVASGDIPIVADTEPRPVRAFRGISGSVGDQPFEPWLFDGDDEALPITNGRAIAPADFDNDGDLDLAISSIGGALILLENRLETGRSITIDLGAVPAGTVVEVTLDDGSVVTRQVVNGGLWLSSGDQRVHVGLGDERTVETIEVTTPSGEIMSRPAPGDGGFVRLDAGS